MNIICFAFFVLSYIMMTTVGFKILHIQEANYANKSFMQFRTNRSLKQKLKQNINEKKVDAFLVN